MKDIYKQYLYYVIIGIVSIIACVFLPMIGSSVDGGFKLPTTTAGWVVWASSKIIVAIVNIMLFYCFMEQAKVNVRSDEKYKNACEILRYHKEKKYIPRSPARFNAKEYGFKGTTIFVLSIASLFAIGQAILTFDLIALCSYIFTIIMGIIFGILQMKKCEIYWTEEFYDYAKLIEKERENDNIQRQRVQESGRTGSEESA